MKFFHDIEVELKTVKERGLFRKLRTVTSAQGAEIEIDGRRVLNFSSNNYLGLADDVRLIEASIDATRRFGTGSGSARLISGNCILADELESCIARFKGTEAALLFNSGYHANIGVLPALADERSVIFSDALNHASLIDGCRLSKAPKVVFQHNDLNHLEDLLKVSTGKKIIVTEAVFSMEGDVCPLQDLLNLAEKFEALVYLDEAHAVGVFGKDGEGLASKPLPKNLICMGTFGKAFGSYGAFVAGSKAFCENLINKARSFIFTTALPAAVLGASLEAIKVVQREPERREKLWDNVKRIGSYASPIISIPIGDARKTMEVSSQLFEEGIFLQGIRPPTVPEGTSRLRLTLMATHTPEQIDRLKQALKKIS